MIRVKKKGKIMSYMLFQKSKGLIGRLYRKLFKRKSCGKTFVKLKFRMLLSATLLGILLEQYRNSLMRCTSGHLSTSLPGRNLPDGLEQSLVRERTEFFVTLRSLNTF